MSEQSIAMRMVRLFTEFPCVGTNDGDFALEMPAEISRASYELVVGHIEFRRKCMHQGFDNLLELLKMHYDAMLEMQESVNKKPIETEVSAPEPTDE